MMGIKSRQPAVWCDRKAVAAVDVPLMRREKLGRLLNEPVVDPIREPNPLDIIKVRTQTSKVSG